ncbi:hypothetical protein PSPO01_10998 [Paraphaeosphaeria sporulosa]
MKFTALLFCAVAGLVAASPAPAPDVSAAQALGATWSESIQAFCCRQEDCKYYDDGCALLCARDTYLLRRNPRLPVQRAAFHFGEERAPPKHSQQPAIALDGFFLQWHGPPAKVQTRLSARSLTTHHNAHPATGSTLTSDSVHALPATLRHTSTGAPVSSLAKVKSSFPLFCRMVTMLQTVGAPLLDRHPKATNGIRAHESFDSCLIIGFFCLTAHLRIVWEE